MMRSNTHEQPSARQTGRTADTSCAPAALPRFVPLAAWSLFFLAALFPRQAAAQNVSVTDYTVPISRANNLRIDVLSFNFDTAEDSVSTAQGNIGVVYKTFYESLPFAYSIDFVGSAAFRKDTIQKRLTGDFTTNLSTRVKKYTNEKGKLFLFGDTNVDYLKGYDRPSLDMTLGFGYGRFINATALRKAVRIEDFLLEEGIISKRLPKETMIELGHIIDKEQEYKDLYGDRSYRNYWFEDMTNVITKSGLVLGDIGFGVLRMDEVLFQENINPRYYGWEATAGVQFNVLTAAPGLPHSIPAMSLGLRYSRPISWSTQINTSLDLTSPFSTDFGRAYDLSQNIDFIYEITNKISFSTLQTFQVTKERSEATTFSTSLLFVFNFFIENKINFSTTEQLNKSAGHPVTQSFNIGLSYRIF